MKKLFTLVELIIVIVVIAILAAIILLNISDWKSEADKAAFASNERELQSAVDRYHLDYGLYPTTPQPTKNKPQLLELDKVVPDYIRNKPKQDYLIEVDERGKVILRDKDTGEGGGSENTIQNKVCTLPQDGGIPPIVKKTCAEATAQGFTCIYTAQELNSMRSDLTGKYILMNDIDLSSWGNWESVGHWDTDTGFSGVFDGNGYSIKNMKVDKQVPDEYIDAVGLFGWVQNATIKNVVLDKPYIRFTAGTNDDYIFGVGGLIGSSKNTTIENIRVKDLSILSDNQNIWSEFIGGIVGDAKETVIKNVMVNGEIVGTDFIGGIAGMLTDGHLENAYADINITGNEIMGGILGELYNSGTFINGRANTTIKTIKQTTWGEADEQENGGLIGTVLLRYIESDILITNSCATGEVEGINSIGGFIGDVLDQSSWYNLPNYVKVDIKNSFSLVNVKGSKSVGGFIGYNNITTYSGSGKITSNIENVYSAGKVTVVPDKNSVTSDVNGFIGYVGEPSTVSFTNAYWDNTVNSELTDNRATGKSTAELKQKSTFIGWDFSNIWTITEGESYPKLK